jgi:hypothetical protein
MKTVLAVLVTALVTSSGAYAVERAVTPRQFSALKAQVQTLQKRQNLILGYIGTCLNQWKPLTQFNNYLALDEQAKQPFETSGLDLTAQGEQPSFFAPTATQDCTLQGTQSLAQVLNRRTLLGRSGPQTRRH